MLLDTTLTIARPSVGDQVNAVINNLADKLRVPVTHLYGVLVRQSFVEGVIDVVTAGLLLVVIITGLVIIRYNMKRARAELGGWTEGRAAAAIISGVVSAFVFLFFLSFLRDGLMELLNPEYGAVHLIVSAIKGG